jgi:hypothetical protein
MQSSLPGWFVRLEGRASALAFLIAILVSAVAHAQPSRSILLVRTPGDEATIARLELEFGGGAFQIIEQKPGQRPLGETLGVSAERERVDAAVRVDAARGTVALWVRKADGFVEETFTATGETSASQVLAIRVAESLRARGLLLPPAPEPGPGPGPTETPPAVTSEAPRSAAAPEPVTPRSTASTAPIPVASEAEAGSETASSSAPARPRSRFALDLGPGVALSPGGLGPLAVVELGVRVRLTHDLALSLLGVVPLTRQSFASDEGEADVTSYVVGSAFELEWARWSFGSIRSGAGGGASITRMSGRAASGFEGGDDTVVAFTPLALSSFQLGLSSSFDLRTALVVGATLPEVQMAFGDREVASWGRPFVVATLGLEARAGR